MTTIHNLMATSIICAATATGAFAQSAANSVALDSATRINAANALVREGKTAEAIADYQQVPMTDTDRDQLTYNLGVAEYREGNIDAAKRYFTEASDSGQTSLAARSRYNLGNCFYSEAVQAAEQDKPAAIDALRQAIGHYRGSLAAEPNHTDARANIELAGQLLRKLQDQQKQDQQKQDQQKQDEQKQDEQKQDEQKQDQQKQDQQKQDQQKQDQQKQDQQKQDEQKQDQQSEDQQTQDAEPQDKQDSKSGKSDSKEEESQPNEEAQQQADEPQEQQPDKQAPAANQPKPQQNKQPQNAEHQQPNETADEKEEVGKDQAVPTGELTAASEQEASEESKKQFGIADPNAENGLMTKEEALKMLQSVRDRDMLRRLRQEQLERSRHIPTDRDW